MDLPDGVEVLSVVDDHIVGVRYGNQIAIAYEISQKILTSEWKKRNQI